MSSTTITLTSSDGNDFTIDRNACMMSILIKEMIDDDDNDDNSIVIPLPNVKDSTLTKVIEFLVHHENEPMADIEKPLKSPNMNEIVSQWDADFVEMEQEELFQLVLAANYMDIKSLLNLVCAKIASMIKDKTPEEIREVFNITNEFTPEEEARIREENKWAEEEEKKKENEST